MLNHQNNASYSIYCSYRFINHPTTNYNVSNLITIVT